MIEKYQLLQSICMIAICFLSILLAISGYGWHYSSKKITELKGSEQKIAANNTRAEILDSITKTKDSVIKEVRAVPKKTSKNQTIKKEETKIDAPNAQIVTSNQTGGSNTVINNSVDLPMPKVNFKTWSIKNNKVSKMQIDYSIDSTYSDVDIKKAFNAEFLFENDFEIKIDEIIHRNEIEFIFKNFQVVEVLFHKVGTVFTSSGGNNNGDYFVKFKSPDAGIYKFKVYSKKAISDLRENIFIGK